SHAFRWDIRNGTKDFGMLQGSPDWASSEGRAINNLGHLAGWSGSSICSLYTMGFFWAPEVGMTALGHLGGYTTPQGKVICSSDACGINDADHVVGSINGPGDYGQEAFLWPPLNGMVSLGTIGGYETVAFAINNFDQVCVSCYGCGEYIWSAQTGMV